MMIDIKIKYRNGTVENAVVDDYKITDGCLMLWTRFIETRYIPLDLIKDFSVH